MDRNSLKARVTRISAWTAAGLILPAIGLIVASTGAKGDVGLHLTVWGIQLMLVVMVLAVTALILRVGLYRITRWIGRRVKRIRISKSGKAATSGSSLATLVDEDEEQCLHASQNKKDVPWGSEGLSAQAYYHWHPLEHDSARAVGVYSRPWSDNEHD